METIIDTARRAGLFAGIGMSADTDLTIRWSRHCVQWVQPGCDFSYMIERFEGLAQAVRKSE